jgi:hypothetical protein
MKGSSGFEGSLRAPFLTRMSRKTCSIFSLETRPPPSRVKSWLSMSSRMEP